MPTHVVSTHEAKSQLSKLIRHAEQGDEVIVARNGQPVAKIIAWPAAVRARRSGAWSGRVEYRTDVVGPDAAVLALFAATDDDPV